MNTGSEIRYKVKIEYRLFTNSEAHEIEHMTYSYADACDWAREMSKVIIKNHDPWYPDNLAYSVKYRHPIEYVAFTWTDAEAKNRSITMYNRKWIEDWENWEHFIYRLVEW